MVPSSNEKQDSEDGNSYGEKHRGGDQQCADAWSNALAAPETERNGPNMTNDDGRNSRPDPHLTQPKQLREQHSHGAFGYIPHECGDEACRAQHTAGVGGANIPASFGTDIDTAQDPYEEICGGNAPEEVRRKGSSGKREKRGQPDVVT